MEWYPSITKTFLRPPLLQHGALARCWCRCKKAPCRQHRFARTLAGYHCKQWVPVDWPDSGLGRLDLKFYSKTPLFLWIVKNNGSLIKNIYDLAISNIYFKKIIEFKKNSSFNWFTPFHVLIRPEVIWKKISRPLYHIHFTVIHTNSRHNINYINMHINTSRLLILIGTKFRTEFHISLLEVVNWKRTSTYIPCHNIMQLQNSTVIRNFNHTLITQQQFFDKLLFCIT